MRSLAPPSTNRGEMHGKTSIRFSESILRANYSYSPKRYIYIYHIQFRVLVFSVRRTRCILRNACVYVCVFVWLYTFEWISCTLTRARAARNVGRFNNDRGVVLILAGLANSSASREVEALTRCRRDNSVTPPIRVPCAVAAACWPFSGRREECERKGGPTCLKHSAQLQSQRKRDQRSRAAETAQLFRPALYVIFRAATKDAPRPVICEQQRNN